MSTSEINAVIDQLTHASVDGASTLSFAGRGLKLDNENDGTSNVPPNSRHFRSRERKVHRENFIAPVELSFLGIERSKNFRSYETAAIDVGWLDFYLANRLSI